MKLTIFAATGGTGRQVLEQAVAAGHEVTAVARNPRKLHAQVRTVTADFLAPDPAALRSAVEGADAVLSGLGPRNSTEYGITSKGPWPSESPQPPPWHWILCSERNQPDREDETRPLSRPGLLSGGVATRPAPTARPRGLLPRRRAQPASTVYAKGSAR